MSMLNLVHILICPGLQQFYLCEIARKLAQKSASLGRNWS
jgi:hypothetical protein